MQMVAKESGCYSSRLGLFLKEKTAAETRYPQRCTKATLTAVTLR